MSNNIIQEIDYRRIKKIEEIREKYFNEELKYNVFLACCYSIGAFLPYFSIFLLFLITIINYLFNLKNYYDSFFGYLVILNFLLIIPGHIGVTAKVKKYREKMKEKNLSIEFFLDKLEEADLKVSTEELKIYEIFLYRYIDYIILKYEDKLEVSPTKYFNKKYVSFLTIEELLISAFVFPTYQSFIYVEPYSG